MLLSANEHRLPSSSFAQAERLLQFLQQAEASQQTAPAPDPPPEAGGQPPPGVLIMVAQPPYRMSLEEASKLTIPAFSALWTVSLASLQTFL